MNLILRYVERVDNPMISDPNAEAIGSFQKVVRIGSQPQPGSSILASTGARQSVGGMPSKTASKLS